MGAEFLRHLRGHFRIKGFHAFEFRLALVMFTKLDPGKGEMVAGVRIEILDLDRLLQRCDRLCEIPVVLMAHPQPVPGAVILRRCCDNLFVFRNRLGGSIETARRSCATAWRSR